MKTLKLYEEVIKGLRLVADDEGFISAVIKLDDKEEKVIVAVDGARLVLPTDKYLKEAPDKGKIAFHPLSENIARGQSPVLRKMVQAARVVISETLVGLSMDLCKIACDNEYHNRLPSSWNDFFVGVSDADDKTLTNFSKMMSAALDHSAGPVGIFLKNRSKLGDVEYLRTCNVQFRIMSEIETGKPYGVSIRKKDIKVFTAIFESILADISTPDAYSVGVTNDVAPYFTALMRAYGNLCNELNETIIKLAALDNQREKIPTGYLKYLDGLAAFKREIPPLAGNEGKILKGSDEPEPAKATATEVKKETVVPWDEPEAAKEVTATTTTTGVKGVSVADYLSGNHNNQSVAAQYGRQSANPYQSRMPAASANPFLSGGSQQPRGERGGMTAAEYLRR